MTAHLASTLTDRTALAVGLGALVVLALVVLVLFLLTAVRLRAVRRDAAQARAQLADLHARIDDLERRQQVEPAADYVITGVVQDEVAPPTLPADIDAPLFADLVLRESVVKAASYAHGLRRALSPETRHRIRFEMRREVKRSRRQRRDDVRAAQRERRARERGAMGDLSEDPA